MSNYTKSTNFATKDNLTPGDPLKIVRGTEIDTEFNNIATAVATKTDNSAAAITGGSITGITDLAIADGGTGASTANAALNNLLPSQTSNANKYLQTDGTNTSWDAVSLSTADITGTLPVTNGGTGVTSSTGTGSVVLSNSPTLVTPALGTPASATLTNATGLPISTGVSGLGTGVATFLATPSSANLASAVTDETGTGALVFANSPTLVTPALGTPSSGTLTNATGLPISTGVSGLGTGVATFLATPSSANLRSALTDETGSGAAVFATSPALVTPDLGTPSAATLTNATGLPVATGISGLGTGVATALAVNVGSAGAPVVNGGALGTPSSGTVTNLTGTASININGTVGATTATTGSFTDLTTSGSVTHNGGTANGVAYLNGSKVLTTGSALTFDGGTFGVTNTTDPRVSVNGSSTANGYLIFKNTTTSTNRGYVGYDFANDVMPFAVASAEQMRLTSTGLGIGTSSPAWKLDVQAPAAVFKLASTTGTNAAYMFATNTGGDFYFGRDNSTGGTFATGSAYSAVLYSAGAYPMVFFTNATERMRLDASGNLGLGRTPVAYGSFRVLNVAGASGAIQKWVHTGSTVELQAYASSTLTALGSATNHPLTFTTNDTERARIDSSGNLLVGTTSAGLSDSKGIVLSNQYGVIYTNHATGQTSGEQYAIFGYAGSLIGSISQSGTTAVAYNTSSDYRLKNTIAPMTGALAKVALLKPCTYKWNADGSDGEGFIAHELAEVVPQCVTGEKDAVDAEGKPQYQGIDTSFLVATLTAAIQEQQAIITALTARVAALESSTLQ